jgi:hypothetical protein
MTFYSQWNGCAQIRLKALWVKLDRSVEISQTCWIENECLGVDQDIRVTRGPFTLKGGVARLLLYVENRNLYKTIEVKFEMVRKKFSKVKHSIKTKGGPSFQRPWRTPQSYQQIIREHIDEMLKCGVIRPGCGAWAFAKN